MSLTIDQILQMFPNTSKPDWHQHKNGGGWVQNTAHVDDCAWVSDNARVSDNAGVSGNAWVSDSAWVSGNARVSGNAWVSGSAWDKSPLYIQGHKHPLTLCARGKIAIGCHLKTFEEWREHADAIGRAEGYSHLDMEIYKLHIEHIERIAKLLWAKHEAKVGAE